jgi:membrane-associated phospholipid phosphatase
MSVAIYNIFPLAPPRLATGLLYHGHPFSFVDTVFKNGGVDLSFDQYAAMPSLHIVWALIAGLALFWLARPLLVRLYGLCHPVLMGWAVVVTGNHYIADCLAGAAVVALAFIFALAVAHGHPYGRPRRK